MNFKTLSRHVIDTCNAWFSVGITHLKTFYYYALDLIPFVHKQNLELLRKASANGDLEVVIQLLAISSVKADAHTNDNAALLLAASNGYADVVTKLLTIKAVSNNAHVNNNIILLEAARNLRWDIVIELLKIEAVSNNAHVENNAILLKAADHGLWSMVIELLKIKNVQNNAHINNNHILLEAANHNIWPVVIELLKIERVKNNAHVNNNAILSLAIRRCPEAALKLLEITRVRNNVHTDWVRAIKLAAQHDRHEIVEILLNIAFTLNANMTHKEQRQFRIDNVLIPAVSGAKSIFVVHDTVKNLWPEGFSRITPAALKQTVQPAWEMAAKEQFTLIQSCYGYHGSWLGKLPPKINGVWGTIMSFLYDRESLKRIAQLEQQGLTDQVINPTLTVYNSIKAPASFLLDAYNIAKNAGNDTNRQQQRAIANNA